MTQTRSRKITKLTSKASKRDITVKALQKSINRPNLVTEHTERSYSTKTAVMADTASTYNTGNTTEDHVVNNPASSTLKDLAPNGPIPAKSTTDVASTYEANSIAEQDALPMASTQPVNTVANDFTPLTSMIADTTFTCTENTTEDYIANNPVPSTIRDLALNDPTPTESTASATSMCNTDSITKQDALPMSTITNDYLEANTSNIADP